MNKESNRNLAKVALFAATLSFFVGIASMVSSINQHMSFYIGNGIVTQLSSLLIVRVVVRGLKVIEDFSTTAWQAYCLFAGILFVFCTLGVVGCFFAAITYHIMANAIAGTSGLVSLIVAFYALTEIRAARKAS